MVVDSGTKFWDNVSETPFEDLRVSEETRAVLRRSLFMTPLPFVNRVIFLATPHRGSGVAGLLIAQFRWLVDWALTLPPSLLRESRVRCSPAARIRCCGAGCAKAFRGASTT